MLFLSLCAAIDPAPVCSRVKEVRRVLILAEVGDSSPVVRTIDQEIRKALNDSPYQIELYREYFETILFPDAATQNEFRQWYIHKYRDRKPDLVITIGPSPLKFMIESHETSFRGVPVVFCAVASDMVDYPKLDANFTGVWLDWEPGETVEAALRLLQGTKHVVVVGGTSFFDQRFEAHVRQDLHTYEPSLDITYLTDLTMPQLLQQLVHLPSHTVVLYTSMSRDAAGTQFIAANQAGPMIVNAANAPVFSLSDVNLDHGELGGRLVNFAGEGDLVGHTATSILAGKRPQDIPIVNSVNVNMFDWKALKRWRLNERDLPPDSVLLNREPIFWEANKRYIIPGVILLLGQTAIILGLLWQRARRKESEAQLTLSNERLRLALDSGKTVGWEWDIATDRDTLFGDLPTMFGVQGDSYTGQVDDFYRYVHPDDRQYVSQRVADARDNRKPYAANFRIVRLDGTVRWVAARGSFEYATSGKAMRMVGMAVDITELKHIEEAFKKSEEKFSKAFRESPHAITLVRAKDYTYIDVNDTFEEMTGWDRQEIIGKNSLEVGFWIDVPKRINWTQRLLAGEVVRNLEVEYQTRQGEIRSGLGSSELIEIDGESCVISVIADITDLKRAETALRESEGRFRLVANAAPIMIWMSDTNKLCTYFNQTWLDFTGRPIQDELGNGWAEGVHPDDQRTCVGTYSTAFDHRASFEMEYKLRRHDGEYRWVYDIGVPRFNADGSLAGYIGSCIDVTERKRAEEALSSVSRRLIEAHEEERARIARELHDDINQRLALLSVKLDVLKSEMPAPATATTRHLDELKGMVKELGNDIQALSHRLHSSKLEYLGLAAAAGAFCEEFSRHNGMQVEFQSRDIAKTLPSEVSLCLFRVLQEALQNAAKHSNSQYCQVCLESSSNEVQVSVSDVGRGFDADESMKGHGLGLISMRERLKLVDGDLSIQSQPGRGTLIRARVPIPEAAKSTTAGS